LSTSFYLYDLIYIILQFAKRKAALNAQGPYVIHHIIALYGLYLSSKNISAEFILMIYYILENSNFMLYIAYHVNKINNYSTNFVKLIELIQYIWYSYFRVIYFSRYIIKNREEIYSHGMIISYFLLGVLYTMGIFWSYKLFQKNMRNISSLLFQEIKPKIE
jgi:hypothetical protein